MTTPGESSKELTDMPQLADLQATDALLDRLAARTPTPEDLDDPIVGDLALLAEFADASPVPPMGVDRLIEVLGGRPLYMFDRSSAAVTEDDRPIQLDDNRSGAAMIDLSGSGAGADAEAGALADAAAASSGDAAAARVLDGHGERSDVAAMALIRNLRLSRRPVATGSKTGWHGLAQQIALPAASVVALVALGGGVSAVVTGDPMAPVYGVSKVASALPGIDSPEEKKIKSARHDIQLAKSAARDNDSVTAKKALDSARTHLTDVPQEHKEDLVKQITQVQSNLSAAATQPAATTPAPQPTPVASVTLPPVVVTPIAPAPDATPPPAASETTDPGDTTTAEPSSGAQTDDDNVTGNGNPNAADT